VTASDAGRCQAPDLLEPVLGFRQWRLHDGGLWSPYSHVLWTTAEQRAHCSAGRHDAAAAPVNSCSCGIYAYYNPCPRTASAGTADFVGGVIAVWGRIELHATGLRASHARMVALELPLLRGVKYRRLLAAAERVGVPVVRRRHLRAVASEHGSPLPRSLQPPAEWAAVANHAPVGVVPRACLAVVHTVRKARRSPAGPSETR